MTTLGYTEDVLVEQPIIVMMAEFSIAISDWASA